ncbi:glucose-methanol-choline oxidoreductase [Xylaria sp. FL1042]|nr:glucose-methanol-choline oxidoreductase [Xylaria sp. FL1042]
MRDIPLGTAFGIPGDNATFDYIIVGGGTAGLTLATRLAEQQSGRVAVVEAGGFYEISNGNFSQVPATGGFFASTGKGDWQPLIDWGYLTTPQTGAYNLSIHYTRGKTLGGSSARNYLTYHRGTNASYQMWADAIGDQSYTFENLLPWFEKSVKFTPPDQTLRFANGTPEYDVSVFEDARNAGPLSVTFPHYVQAFATWTTKGLLELGFPIIQGLQSGSLLGQSYAMSTVNAQTMERDSSETAFLRPALTYPNYMVYTQTLAKQILFNGTRAVGVKVDTDGFEYILSATKEVILSAGVFNSPQLLMVSGVGPAETLSAHGVPVLADRKGVGKGMQDHIYFGPSYRVNAPTLSALQDTAFAAKAAVDYQTRAAGMYTSTGVDVLGWEKLPNDLRRGLSNATLAKLSTYPADWPELEYIGLSLYTGWQNDSRHGDPDDGYNYASLAPALVMPFSRGTVSIASADAAVAPLIDPGFLTDEADVELAIAGYKRARQFWKTKAMQPFLVSDTPEAFPGASVKTDAQILDIIKRSYNTVYHGACTCSMGKEDDDMAVVDPQGRVYGVQGLRVVDASIFPLLPPGHPMATVYAVAEKIACDITGAC